MKTTTTALSLFTFFLFSQAASAVTLDQCRTYDRQNIETVRARLKASDRTLFTQDTVLVTTSYAIRSINNEVAKLMAELVRLNPESVRAYGHKAQIVAQFSALGANFLGLSEAEKSTLMNRIQSAQDYLGVYTAINDWRERLEEKSVAIFPVHHFPERWETQEADWEGLTVEFVSPNQKISTTIKLPVEFGDKLLKAVARYELESEIKQSILALDTCELAAKFILKRDIGLIRDYFVHSLRAKAEKKSCHLVSEPTMFGIPNVKELCEYTEIPYAQASKKELADAWKYLAQQIENIDASIGK